MLPGDGAWPGAQQVFRSARRRVGLTTAEVQTETTEGLTSLAAPEADPSEILHLLRAHWLIENQSHYVRDVTFDEDRSQIRSGTFAEVLAAFRQAALGLFHCAGERTIAGACRRCAAQPGHALELLGIYRE